MKMRCENFNSEREVCSKGMPISELYKGLVCRGNPGKCPLVINVLELEAAGLN